MGILFFSFCFFLFIFSSAAYNVINSDDVLLGWNVTYDKRSQLKNGRIYSSTTAFLYGGRSDSTIAFGLFFLGDKKSGKFNLSIVAWDTDAQDVADVIWAAGPVGYNATLQLEADGNLALKNETHGIVWSTNTSNQGVKRMRFTEFGALLLLSSTNHTVWSSFNPTNKNPTNKLVCGQLLQPGMEITNGDYHFRAEKNGFALYFHEHVYQERYLKHNVTTFVVLCCDINYATLQLRSDKGNISDAGYYTQNHNFCGDYEDFTIFIAGSRTNGVTYEAAVTLGEDGVLTVAKLSLQLSTSQSVTSCDLPNYCGQYGLCSPNSINGTCGCPLNSTYFKPIDESNRAAGCQFASGYSNSEDCKMVNQSGIDYYETAYSSPNQTQILEDFCYKSCLKHSTCKAAFYNLNTTDCFLIDQIYSLKAESTNFSASFKLCKEITPPPNGTSNGTPPPNGTSKSSNSFIIALVTAGICFLLFVAGFVVYLKLSSRKEGEEEDGILSSYLSGATLKRFSLKELEQITDGFSKKLGSGGFGTVYKGQLPNGNYVAVKSLNGLMQEAKDFYAELSVLSRVRHFNLVQLLGFCSNQKARALVYEYMANGSLDHWLLGKNISLLSWDARMDIAIGSAKGMAYLHEDCLERILHLDVKPQNILLDNNFCPKVSDFGLSRLLDREEDHFFMTTICGTPGYLAPELMMGEAIGVESDIYSYGVVLLEILIGVRPIRPKGEEIWNLSGDDHAVNSLVDSRLGKTFNLEEARRMIRTAALCINHEPSLRPQMSSVVQMLEGTLEIPQFVTAPKFYPNIQAAVNDKFTTLLESRSQISASSQAEAVSISTSVLFPR